MMATKFFILYFIISMMIGGGMMMFDMAKGFPSLRHKWYAPTVALFWFGPILALIALMVGFTLLH